MNDSKWYKVKSYRVLVENGKVVRGAFEDVTVYPYKSTREGWTKGNPKLSTLRNGLRSGTWIMR